MTTNTEVLGPTGAGSSDERWTRWVARGVEHDRKIKARGTMAVFAVAGGLALWSTIALMFG
jgi:hypothetical protein